MAIKGFFGDNRWLSNFYESPFLYKDKLFSTVEHFYQAKKAGNEDEFESIRLAKSPAEAKRLGKLVTEFSHNMPHLKRMVMKIGLEHKFIQNEDLRAKLLETGEEYLEETNSWGDTYWGVCNGVGQNHLGYTLMQVRRDFRTGFIWL